MSHPVSLPWRLVLGDILPVQGFRCHGAVCDAVRQVDCEDETEERQESGSVSFCGSVNPFQPVSSAHLSIRVTICGCKWAAWLTNSVLADGPELDLPRTCHARDVWAVKVKPHLTAPQEKVKQAPP